jgi:hypothetical protein
MSELLKQRFKDFSISPPPSVWEAVASHLDATHENSALANRIHSVSVNPPSDAWNLIFSQLQQDAIRIPQRSKLITGRVLGRAAVVAGVVLIGSFLYFMQGDRSQQQKSAVVASNSTDENTVDVVATPQKKQVRASAMPRISSLYSALTMKKKAPATRALSKSVITEEPVAVPEVNIPAKPIRDESGEIIQYISLAEGLTKKYVSVTGPNGQQTKISSKFANLLLYLNDDNDTDENEGVFTRSFLESLLWKSRFQSWRNAISQTAYIPSSTNFMDILEFRDLILQEKDIN